MFSATRKTIITFTFLIWITATLANEPIVSKYQKKELKIAMRDGIKLNTVIFTPKRKPDKLPFIFLRTPYGVSELPYPDQWSYLRELADEGYIFVFQDLRGRYKSEGKFEMQRFTRNKNDQNAIDESTDTYDTMDWLLKNIDGNNGKAGMLGISYDGWTSMMGAIDPHPALIAVSAQASPADMFLGDDFHHNGAFRLGYAFEYSFMEEAGKTDSLFGFDEFDTYEWFLKLGPLQNVNEKYFHSSIPSWNNFANHPNYDSFWIKQSMAYRLDSPRVNIMHVAGWWDQEDFYGPLKSYEVLEKQDRRNKNYIVIGPWNHGGWGGGNGSNLGSISFDTSTSISFRKDIQATWFAYHLKGKGDGKFPEAITFQTGSNVWKTYDKWPPREARKRQIYIAPNGKLTFTQPNSNAEISYDEYVSDPFRPVPYRSRPIEQTYGPESRWYTWLVEDQRFVHNRPDVLSWESDELNEDFIVSGNVFAKLFASTSGSDCDWIVKLIDVYPEKYDKDSRMSGYQLMVANEVFRGRFRNSFEKPEAIEPGKVEQYMIDMRQANHVFKKGHRIMVQVQSSWFPLIDMNPQKFVPNIFEAKQGDFQKATQRLYRSASAASHIEVDVIE
jgi:uncharacterized protein